LTNPISIALGIGPICRGKTSGSGGGGGGSSAPGYPYKDDAEASWWSGATEGTCGCAILEVPHDLFGVTYAKECARFCCEHCPSRSEHHCPAERLRLEGVLRAYRITDTKYSLGYWTDETEGDEIWGVFWCNKDSLLTPGDLYKTRLQMGQSAFEGLGRANSLLGAQILALQKTPLKAS
jgi:hypothetical protein